MSRGAHRFGRALNATFLGTGNLLGGAADLFIGPGFGNSFRTAGRLTGMAAGVLGEAGWTGATIAAGGLRDRRSRDLMAGVEDALTAGDLQLVLRLAREFSQREPKEPMGPVWQAMALSGLGQPDEAARAVHHAAQRGLSPSEVERLLAEIDVAAEDFTSAVTHFTKLAGHPERRAEALTGRAGSLIRLGRPGEALRDADEAISLAPSAGSYLIRAHIHRAGGRIPQCLDDFNRANALSPSNPRILDGRAAVLEHMGREIEAQADRAVVEAAELLDYLVGSGVHVSLSPNGQNLELRGASVGNETMARITRLKPQIKDLLTTC